MIDEILLLKGKKIAEVKHNNFDEIVITVEDGTVLKLKSRHYPDGMDYLEVQDKTRIETWT